MLPLKGLFKKQAEHALRSQSNALLYAGVLAVLPYCTWLAMAMIALVTLRKGERYGRTILAFVMLVHGSASLATMPLYPMLINTAILFIPVYLAACCLRATSSWQAVAAMLFLMVIVCSLVIQEMIPEWVMSQFAFVQSLIKAQQSDQVLNKWLSDSSELPVLILANFTLGLQFMSAVVSLCSALMTARSLQSQLYYPGGFTQELLSFRGNRLSCLVMVLLVTTAFQGNVVAINVLPVLVMFYLLAGLSLCANFFKGKKAAGLLLVLLILPMIVVPFLVLPFYILIGLLDRVFNIRLAFCR